MKNILQYSYWFVTTFVIAATLGLFLMMGYSYLYPIAGCTLVPIDPPMGYTTHYYAGCPHSVDDMPTVLQIILKYFLYAISLFIVLLVLSGVMLVNGIVFRNSPMNLWKSFYIEFIKLQ